MLALAGGARRAGALEDQKSSCSLLPPALPAGSLQLCSPAEFCSKLSPCTVPGPRQLQGDDFPAFPSLSRWEMGSWERKEFLLRVCPQPGSGVLCTAPVPAAGGDCKKWLKNLLNALGKKALELFCLPRGHTGAVGGQRGAQLPVVLVAVVGALGHG